MSQLALFTIVLFLLSALYMLILWFIFKGTVTFKISAAEAASLLTVSFVSFIIGNKGISAVLWAGPLVGVAFVSTYAFMNRFLGRPLRKTYDMLGDMAEGEGDLSGRLEISSKDELGKISVNFNKLVAKLSAIIAKLRSVGATGASIGTELATSSEELAATVEEMTRTIEGMRAKIASQSEEIAKSNSDVQRIGKAIETLGGLINEESNSVGESSSAIEEMIASIKSIEEVTGAKKAISDRLAALAHEGERGMASTVSEIGEIAKSAQTISDFVGMIDDITSKTNLLAMNAAIEASHAGAAGKGFAVVAAEIRKLAETTAMNSKSIAESLKTIVDKIAKTSETSARTGDAISEVIAGIKDVSNGMNETLSGMRELSLGSERITESLSGLVRISGEVRSDSRSMRELVKRVGGSMQSVDALAQENRVGMDEVSKGAEEIARAAVSLANLSAVNADNMTKLETEISRFKTGG